MSRNLEQDEAVGLRLPKGLLKEIDRAVERGWARSRSKLIRQAILLYLGVDARAAEQLKALSENPALPRLETALKEIVGDLKPEALQALAEAFIGPYAELLFRTLGVSKKKIKEALEAPVLAHFRHWKEAKKNEKETA